MYRKGTNAMADNYSVMLDSMRQRFLASDMDRIAHAFSLETEEGYIRLRFLGEELRIVRSTAEVQLRSGGMWIPAGFDDAMSVYDILTYSPGPPVPSGDYVNLKSLGELSGASFSHSPGGFFSRQSEQLTGKAEELRSIFRSRGWPSEEGRSDAGCFVPVFSGIKVLLRFWDADEDFPAQLQFLWDRSVLQMMHYETVWFASSAVVRRIMSDLKEIKKA